MESVLGPLVSSLSVDEVLNLKILDPALGSGHFLLGVAKFLEVVVQEKLLLQSGDQAHIPDQIKERIVNNCLYGVDINPLSLELAKFSLWIYSSSKGAKLGALSTRFMHGNSVMYNLDVNFQERFSFSSYETVLKSHVEAFLDKIKDDGMYSEAKLNFSNKYLLDWKSKFPFLLPDLGFDAVITNPPYLEFGELQKDVVSLAFMKSELKLEYKFNLYTAILNNAILLLKENGTIGFICPNSISKEKYNVKLRRKLVDEFTFLEVMQLSDNTTEGKIFTAASNDGYFVYAGRKLRPDPGTCFDVVTWTGSEFLVAGSQPQADIALGFEYQFNFFRQENKEISSNIVEKIERASDPLSSYCKIRSGITPSRAYKLKYGADYGTYKLKYRQNPNYRKFLKANKGETIVQAFKIAAEDFGIVWDKASLYEDRVSPGELALYDSRKIITRNRGKVIFAAYDESKIVVNDIFNVCVPINEADAIWEIINLEFLVGLLNSKLFNFYFKEKFSFRDFKSTFLKLMPVSSYTKEFVEIVTEMVCEIQNLRSESSFEWQSMVEILDLTILDFYGLTAEETEIVLNYGEDIATEAEQSESA
ncbi:MAG: hypothetical protein EOP04_15405 [Proteobacteria bacterium]|nr:MAG: hypothetical protein EOP04_15405 [Pseudomonadota bacterium]